ncbi:FAD/NAD(P)-binding protein [Brevundimonas sp.]|uniref:FAD/NAD(P)-binding protein n=1 Tax=Brevundimonas sp. TaxID=1871086 RepID=UPI0028A1944A|nr:FAD/NAD(P)-binding protein [Brevundimonas sp.]
MRSIAFVGAGPTTLYTLKFLLADPLRDVRITVLEAKAEAGVGSPYSPGWNDPAMLSNIASAEIPPVTETLLGWVQARSGAELREMGIEVADFDDRTFAPRLVLGRFFRDQFRRLVEAAREGGVAIDVRTGCSVVDVVNQAEGVDLTWSADEAAPTTARFDHVVLATGHQWPSRQQVRPGYFASPWPAAALAEIPPIDVGIRGSSLTAIDAAVALAGAHGAFVRREARLDYEPAPGTEDFRITMMSRKGLLPEADFYFPLPHAPLTICTPEAIGRLIKEGEEALLDRAFDLFRREMIAVDPGYAAAIGLADASLEAFGEAYFAARAAADPFAWAASNLAEARATHAARATVPWRDALLRMHEVMAAVTPHLDSVQFSRFSRSLKPVFVDAYGGVPHESVERMLALHRAGKLEVLALGDDYRIDTQPPEGGARLIRGGAVRRFPVFIEATGQKVLGAIQFPFLSLIEQGVVRDASSDEETDGARGVEIDDHFNLVADGLPTDRLFCLSLPFIMGRHPFAQGLTSSHAMGEIVGRRLASILGDGHASIDTLPAVA